MRPPCDVTHKLQNQADTSSSGVTGYMRVIHAVVTGRVFERGDAEGTARVAKGRPRGCSLRILPRGTCR